MYNRNIFSFLFLKNRKTLFYYVDFDLLRTGVYSISPVLFAIIFIFFWNDNFSGRTLSDDD